MSLRRADNDLDDLKLLKTERKYLEKRGRATGRQLVQMATVGSTKDQICMIGRP